MHNPQRAAPITERNGQAVIMAGPQEPAKAKASKPACNALNETRHPDENTV